MPQLNEMPYPMKGAMYWPSNAREPTWWPYWIGGEIKNEVIEADLDLLVDTQSNTVRVFIPYKNPASWGFIDSNGDHDKTALEYLIQFIEIAKSKGLFVVPTIFQEMEVVENGGFPIPTDTGEPPSLIKYRDIHEDFIKWFMLGIRDLTNVPVVIVKNEPDGFGAWDSPFARDIIIDWLIDMYAAAREVAPNIRLTSVATTHVNLFTKVGQQSLSLYDIADVPMFNQFRWCDNGDWETQTPPNWLQYAVERNHQKKPLVLSEFGWPSHYEHSGAVPGNQEFDQPRGHQPESPSTEDTQKRAYAETIAWIEIFTAQEKGLHGALVWSLIDKPGPTPLITYFRDPFGMFDANRNPKDAVEWFTRLYTNDFTASGRLWQPITRAQGEASINGRDGTVGPMGGAEIASGLGLSVQAIARIPIGIEYEVKFSEVPLSDGVALKNDIVGGAEIHIRREESSRRWRLFYNGKEKASTASSPMNLIVGEGYRLKVEIGVYRGFDQYGVAFYVNDDLIPWQSPEPYFTQRDLLFNPAPGLFVTGVDAGLSKLELYSIQLLRLKMIMMCNP